jgi:hypothetical protein
MITPRHLPLNEGDNKDYNLSLTLPLNEREGKIRNDLSLTLSRSARLRASSCMKERG